MLHQAFNEVYTKFKLHFYQEIFRRFQDREASLTTVETFCMESIMALGRPSVNEFATFMRISPPNAAYKVNSLVQKGYVHKCVSESDRREVRLDTGETYDRYFQRDSQALRRAIDALRTEYSEQEIAAAGRVINSLLRYMEEEEQTNDRPV